VRRAGKIAVVFGLMAVFAVGSLAAAQEEITLRFPSWQWGQPGYDEFFTAAIEEFEATHPGVTIEKIPVASADYADTLTRMFAAGDPPEILQYLSQLYYLAVEADWLEELDDRIAQTDIQETWAPYLWEAGNQYDHTYGVWVSGSPIALMYNRDMFEAAGVEVPTTKEELLEAARALTLRDADGTVTQFGFALTTKMDNNAHIYGLKNFVIGLGGNWGNDEGEIDVMNPANREAIELEQTLIDESLVPHGADRVQARQIFWEGRAAMIIEGPWVMTSVRSENPDLLPSIGVALMPFPNQTAGTSNGFAIARDAEHKDLAWEFIQMITSQEWMERYGEMTGVTPARQGALTETALEQNPWLEVFAEVESSGKNYFIPGFEAAQNEIDKGVIDALAEVFYGDKSVDAALEEIQALLESLRQ
jgi:multiple sugar transport system substrate-binding protein